MGFQRQVNSVLGVALGKDILKSNKTKGTESGPTSKDIEMAKKARKVAQDKINAIYLNKDISNKARTRRMGKILDEYKGGK